MTEAEELDKRKHFSRGTGMHGSFGCRLRMTEEEGMAEENSNASEKSQPLRVTVIESFRYWHTAVWKWFNFLFAS
jgi:hypothetical protein